MDRLHAVLPSWSKRCFWDIKYRFLKYPQFVAPDDVVRYLSPRLPQIATVLDFGCGRGSLLRVIRDQGWVGRYCGVDISQASIEDARKFGDLGDSWFVCDFESFNTTLRWDLIAMVESIYYIRLGHLPTFLKRITGMLAPNGSLLLRIHDLERHSAYVDSLSHLSPQAQKIDQSLFLINCPSAEFKSADDEAS